MMRMLLPSWFLIVMISLVTIPWSGHFVQQDAAEFVTKSMVRWLTQ